MLRTSHKALYGVDEHEELVVHEEEKHPHHHTAHQQQQADGAKSTDGQKLDFKTDMEMLETRNTSLY